MRRKICIGIIWLLMLSQTSQSQATLPASDTTSLQSATNHIPTLTRTSVEAGPDSEEWLGESASSLEIEHESNGPEGAPGVPMQRGSVKQIALAVGIILACWGVTALDKRDSVSGSLPK